MAERLQLFATATRGTEPFLALELEALGAKRIRQDRGGVRFLANLDEAMRVLVHSRVAMRVLYPLGEFEVQGAEGLYEACSQVQWEDWLTTQSTFAVEATLKDSEHNHTGFVALKVKDAIVDRLREKLGRRPNVSKTPDVSVVAHLAKTTLSLSLDLCGEALFKRGYRIKTTPAPLKETLAAAILMAAGYDGSEPLADPLCGSGTLVIEAGHIATGRPPGLKRHFGVERWPAFATRARALLDEVKREAASHVRPAPFPILARDRDPDALAAVRRNVIAAGLQASVSVEEADATQAGPPEGAPGLLVTNPPYGERLGEGGQKGMKSFFFKLGEALQGWHGWRMAVLAGNPAFESAFHRKPSDRLTLWNGPIECRLLTYDARARRASRTGGSAS
jgi:23S rRNA (guanine2445-N2)-methyltransferase / 23S rRNA (guanine2069-N7)-methyltransferase